MKLQYLMIVFIIIAIPMIILLTYYMSLQKQTISMQTSYDTKLIESTKQAMEAFEVNTVEWDNGFSRYGDSKRRDILASINTFKNSFANSLNLTGTTKESILTYIPAIMYNLYDGYYIYTPTSVPITKNNSDGVQLFQDRNTRNATTESLDIDGNMNKILYVAESGGTTYTYKYINEQGNEVTETLEGLTTDVNNAKKEYKHILKTFVEYSEKKNNIVINYTLDNYIRAYTNSDAREGYLIDTTKLKNINGGNPINTMNIVYDGNEIKPEELSENVRYIDTDGSINENIYNYVYNTTNEKCYYDKTENRFFKIINNKRVNLNIEMAPNMAGIEYKAISIIDENTGEIKKIYQALNGIMHNFFFEEGILSDAINYQDYVINFSSGQYGLSTSLWTKPYMDYSAINYYTEGYVFTNWVNSLNLPNYLKINSTNNPEDENSLFNIHKKEVMKESIISNLNLAISSYSAHSNYEFSLPVFTYQDWEQILCNISMTTFVQNIPIGLKHYNNYVVAISSNNKEYINPNEIYYISEPDYYYHLRNCDKIQSDVEVITGYRNIDFIVQAFENGETTNYYFKHATINSEAVNTANEKCYYCLISKHIQNPTARLKALYDRAYLHAIARERYVQKNK